MQDVTIIEFGTYLSAPLLTTHLQRFGAKVISVQRPRSARGANAEASWYPAALSSLRQNKQIVTINLKTKGGLAKAKLLVQAATVVVENFSAGVMDRLGLGPEACKGINPSIIYLSLPGFASGDTTTPHRAWESLILASLGIFKNMGINRRLMGIEASYSPLPLASAAGSVLGAFAIMCVLYKRRANARRSPPTIHSSSSTLDRCEIIQVPLASALSSMLCHNILWFDGKAGDLVSSYDCERVQVLQLHSDLRLDPKYSYNEVTEMMDPFYSHYTCLDGKVLYLVAPSHERHQRRTLEVLQLTEIIESQHISISSPYLPHDDCRERRLCGIGGIKVGNEWSSLIRRMFIDVFKTKTTIEWESLLQKKGVPCAVHKTTEEWMKDQFQYQTGLALSACTSGVPNSDCCTIFPGPIAWVQQDTNNDANKLKGDSADESTKFLQVVEPHANCSMSCTKNKRRKLSTGANYKGQADSEEHENTQFPPTVDACTNHRGSWLTGVRVVDLTNVIAGPTIGSMLAQAGADVIKIDSPVPLYAPNITVKYGYLSNRGKRSMLLDLKQERGYSIFKKIVKDADLVIANSTVEGLRALRIDAGSIAKINPRARLIHFDAWGGPTGKGAADAIAYDDNVQAGVGIMERFGGGMETVEEHAQVGVIDTISGFAGALSAVYMLYSMLGDDESKDYSVTTNPTLHDPPIGRASLAALGQLIQYPFCCIKQEGNDSATTTAMQGDSLSTNVVEGVYAPLKKYYGPGCRGEHALHYEYKTSDGEWMIIVASLVPINSIHFDPNVLLGLSKCMQSAELNQLASRVKMEQLKARDGNNRDHTDNASSTTVTTTMEDDVLRSILSRLFLDKPRSDWIEILNKEGISAMALDPIEAVKCRNVVDNPDHDGGSIQIMREAVPCSDGCDSKNIGDEPGYAYYAAPVSIRANGKLFLNDENPAPKYGEATLSILECLGYDKTEISNLVDKKVVGTQWSDCYIP